MSLADFIALLPLILPAAAALAALGVLAWRRRLEPVAWLARLGLGGALASLPAAWTQAPHRVEPLFVVDAYGLFFAGVILAAALLVSLLSEVYLRNGSGRSEEFPVLLLLASLGAAGLAVSSHFISLFLSLELLSITLYVLLAYTRAREDAVEAGVKYLVLGSVSTAFLAFGMALIYARLGTMELAPLREALAARMETADLILLAGVGLTLAAFAFKLSLVPFHLWAPDVYQGSAAPAGVFLATASKAAVAAPLFRYVSDVGPSAWQSLLPALGIIAAASMLAGNLLALLQNNLRRILAYSSVSHFGYLLVALLAQGSLAREAAGFYLAAYVVTLAAAFGTVAAFSSPARNGGDLESYRGLFWESPAAGTALITAMLSLAGIPLTAGFIGKFYVFAAGVEASLWLMIFLLVATSAIGLFYYLRVVVVLISRGTESPSIESAPERTPAVTRAALIFSTVLILVLGVFPAPLMNLIHRAFENLAY